MVRIDHGCVQMCKLLLSVWPGSLLLLALVIRYRDPEQNIGYQFALLNAAQFLCGFILVVRAVVIGYWLCVDFDSATSHVSSQVIFIDTMEESKSY